MKPRLLTMIAFGPYKNKEVIDFSNLDHNSLFVISGNTGAGKTTIFDGISFALYGSASGQDRENHAMLRSDFADDDTHTAVELEFELNGSIYRILRQLGHVKKGNKSRTGERYELFEKVNGKEIPCVDRQIVSEIDIKIEELMGLTQDQFKQIVMLPQGEFRKLLTSQTENKEEILRRLFKTEQYKHISERLKIKRDIVEEAFKLEKQTKDNYIKNISAILPRREDSLVFTVLTEEYYNINQLVAGLDAEITYYDEQIKVDEKKYEDAYKGHDKKVTEYHQSKTSNEQFEQLDSKKDTLKNLDDKIPLFTERENQLEEAERASNIEPYEKQTEDWRKAEKERVIVLSNAKKAEIEAGKKLIKVNLVYEQEESKKNLREEISRKLDRYKDFLPTVKEIDESKQILYKLENNVRKNFNELEKVTLAIKEGNTVSEQDNDKIKKMDNAVNQLQDKQIKLIDMREQAKVLIEFINLTAKQTKLDQDIQVEKKAFDQTKAEYIELEQVWLGNQASILATHLHDGEACPVCGSDKHPNKATNEKRMVTRDQLDALKKNLDEKESIYRTVIATHNVNKSQLQEKIKEIEQYQIQVNDAASVKDQLVEDGKRLKDEVEKLESTQKELIEFKKTFEKKNDEIKLLESMRVEVEQSYLKLKSSFETSDAVFKERLRVIPEEVRVLPELVNKISETKKHKLRLEKEWDDAQKNLQQANEEKTKVSTNVANNREQLEETKAKRIEAEEQFEKALSKAGFDSEYAYNQAKLSLNAQKQLKAVIEGFKRSLSTLKQQVEELTDLLKDKVRVDLTLLDQQLQNLKLAYESALNTLNQSKEYKQEAIKLKDNIVTSNQLLKKLEKQYGMITDLYDVIRGQNSQKISFERYLQIEYLEQIIDASNQRLKRLSNGQFLLIRSERQESHGRQSGLAFDIYDAYTGQTRDVKTLSGGEKFNTSLCLALGMSDVIQSFQGNISINTMFIDEGFGSLDEESLNKSIDTLIDLQQSGRMIGVISHVQELKEIFPAVLEVTKTKEGYSQTEFLIK